jgi:hypothetical protein
MIEMYYEEYFRIQQQQQFYALMEIVNDETVILDSSCWFSEKSSVSCHLQAIQRQNYWLIS